MAAATTAGAGLLWVVTFVGPAALDRFRTLLETPPTELYYRNRGHLLQGLLEVGIWEYPLGAGLGRWGMINVYFGDPAASPLALGRDAWGEEGTNLDGPVTEPWPLAQCANGIRRLSCAPR